MKRGAVQQRHLRSCPRDADGQLLPHRCRGSWGYVLEAGRRPDGGRRQVARAGFATKREAQAALDEALARERSGIAHLQALTVADYLQDWLAGKRKLRHTTRRNYETHLRRYLVPALGRIRLAELRPDHIDALYSDVLDGRVPGATATTAHHMHRTLRSALNTAVKRRLIPWNPALHVELPEVNRRPGLVWSPEDVATFLDTAREHRLGAVFHLIAFTGMRRGEALGLHWVDVSEDGPHLLVRAQVTQDGPTPVLGPPKTRSGTRLVPIDTGTLEVLRAHRQQQRTETAQWGALWQDHGLVFTREDGSLIPPDSVTKLFGQLVRKAGVPRIRLHDLRHTHASLALAAGVDIKVVSDRLGHSRTSITSDLYTHVVPAVARAAADAIAAVIPMSPTKIPSAFLAQEPLRRGGRGPPPDDAAGQSTE